MSGDVRDSSSLARSVGGMPRCSAQISGRAHCMAARSTSLHHLDLATYPSAGMLDRVTRSRVLWLSRLEKVKNVLCVGCRPQSEEMVIRVGEGPPATDRHQARISDLREDHGWNSYQLDPPPRAAGTRPLTPQPKPVDPLVDPLATTEVVVLPHRERVRDLDQVR